MPLWFDGLHVCHEGTQLICTGGFPCSVADDEHCALLVRGVFGVGGIKRVQRIDPCVSWFGGVGWNVGAGWF